MSVQSRRDFFFDSNHHLPLAAGHEIRIKSTKKGDFLKEWYRRKVRNAMTGEKSLMKGSPDVDLEHSLHGVQGIEAPGEQGRYIQSCFSRVRQHSGMVSLP